MTFPLVLSVLLATILGSAAPAAAAEIELLAGKRLVLRQSPKGERLVLLARDALVAPLPGGTDDPTVTGALLEIGNPGTGEWARLEAPSSGWTLNGVGMIFRYRSAPARSPGLRAVIHHGKRIKVTAASVGMTLDEAAQGGVAVVLTAGTRRYCMLFGGAVRRDEPGRFAARNAPAPPACPAPASATSTTSTTSSTTTTPTATVPVVGTTSSSTSSTPVPTTSTTTSTAQPTSTTSSSSSTTSSTTSTTSTSSTTSSTLEPCGGIAPFCGGTCPRGEKCGGSLFGPCQCAAEGAAD